MRNLINKDEGAAQKLNLIYKDWQKIRTAQEHKKWKDKVQRERFGTYSQFNALDILPNFELNFPNEIIRKGFFSEVREAYEIKGK